MKVLGLVEWTKLDRNSCEIAGVKPLFEIPSWRPINAHNEFPSQGQAFWANAQTATKDALISFRTEPNHSDKYEFKVVEPKPAFEVLDLRQCGTIDEARAALIKGVPVPGPRDTTSFLIWCNPDILVGPVELKRSATGTATLAGTNKHSLALYTGAQVYPVIDDRYRRLVRVDDNGPSGHVDWDDDALVLRRALDAAVRIMKNAGHDPGTTKKQIEEAARVLAAQAGPNVQLDSYRLERASALLGKTDIVSRHAGELAAILGEVPSIKASVESLRAQVRADTEQSVRAELNRELAREHAALAEASADRERAMEHCKAIENELSEGKDELAKVQSKIANAATAVEAAVDERVLAAIDRPLDLLAEVSVLRPLLGIAARVDSAPAPKPVQTTLDWVGTRAGEVSDRAALNRVLTSAARARGVDPALMLQIHAAVVARLMPVTLGPAALAALTAYAHAACAGRMLIVHVSPGAIQPDDLHAVPGGGLLAAASAARDLDGLSLVILEGMNRAPIEGAVVPVLQLTELGLPPLAAAGGLRLTASLVAGATTVPVTPQIWSHAAVIYPNPTNVTSLISASGGIRLSSDLLVPGDEPTGEIDALLDAWPDCHDLKPTMCRYGSALARFYTDEHRVRDALLHGLILPYVATALAIEEQADAVSRAGDTDGAISLALRRLRRRLT